MTERLLQYIWQFQYFNKSELQTCAGEKVQVIHPGFINTHQGPDFADAKILIDDTTWAGNVELHLLTSHWHLHGHHTDKNYNNVILHVVWQDDQPGKQLNIPVIELNHRVSNHLISRYQEWMNRSSFIPCENAIAQVKNLTWQAWLDRLLAERLTRKAEIVFTFLNQTNNSWEDTFWWLLARNFGARVNADAFEQIARSIPLQLLAKHKNNLLQLEALLLGQAGLLKENATEDYAIMLHKEYAFLKNKYKLKPLHIPPMFLRMRPGNFPGIRLAQLAMLVHHSSHLFSKIKEAINADEIKDWLNVTANDYWHYHYRLDEPSAYKPKNLGRAMINNIIINTMAPILYAYGRYHQQELYKEKALKWLESCEAEKNTITKGYQGLGIKNASAADSQALIELKNEYCSYKRCLECAVGNAIIRE